MPANCHVWPVTIKTIQTFKGRKDDYKKIKTYTHNVRKKAGIKKF